MASLGDTRLKIHQIMEAPERWQLPRQYLGGSQLNHPCARYLWYTFRWCYKSPIHPRNERIFERGHLEEPRVIRDLIKHDMTVSDSQKELDIFMGHIKAHPDGVVHNVPDAPKTPHLLEIKTMANKYFVKVKKNGVQEEHQVYYGQAQTYMGEMGLTRGLFIITNKDNEDRYYERVKFDPGMHEMLNMKGIDIVTTEVPPPKIGNSDWYECKMCDAARICHFDRYKLKTCRTCTKVSMMPEGKWRCNVNCIDLSLKNQEEACMEYEPLRFLNG